MIMIILSAIVAVIGLIRDNAAVIIGAMVIAQKFLDTILNSKYA